MREYSRHLYTIAQLHGDIERYHIRQLYIWGHLGAIEVPFDILDDIIQDGFYSKWAIEPIWTSPWMLSVPHTGIGILSPNPRGRLAGQDGLRGWVYLDYGYGCASGRSYKPYAIGSGRSRSRRFAGVAA